VERRSRDLILRYYPSICQEGLSKTTKNLTQDSRSPARDLNPEPPEYETLCYPLYHDVRLDVSVRYQLLVGDHLLLRDFVPYVIFRDVCCYNRCNEMLLKRFWALWDNTVCTLLYIFPSLFDVQFTSYLVSNFIICTFHSTLASSPGQGSDETMSLQFQGKRYYTNHNAYRCENLKYHIHPLTTATKVCNIT
jgi:hypothetical protein